MKIFTLFFYLVLIAPFSLVALEWKHIEEPDIPVQSSVTALTCFKERLLGAVVTGKIELINAQTHEKVFIVEDPEVADIVSAAFNNTNGNLFYRSYSKLRPNAFDPDYESPARVTSYDVEAQKEIYYFDYPYRNSPLMLQVNNNGNLLAFHSGSSVLICDPRIKGGGTASEIVTKKGYFLKCIRLHPTNDTIATLNQGDNSIRVWDLRNNSPVITLNGESHIEYMDYASDTTLVSSGGNMLTRWDIDKNPQRLFQTPIESDKRQIKISPHNKQVITEHWNRGIFIRDTNTLQTTQIIGYKQVCAPMQFNEMGTKLYIPQQDNRGHHFISTWMNQ